MIYKHIRPADHDNAIHLSLLHAELDFDAFEMIKSSFSNS